MLELRLPADATEPLPVVAEHQAVEFLAEAVAGSWLVLVVDGQQLVPFLHPGETIWRWRWNPGAAVGVHRVVVARGGEQHTWQLRVAPRKIDQERYAALLADLQQVAHTLVYQLGAASSESAARSRVPADTLELLESYYALVEGQLPGFVRAVERIALHPRETLARESIRQPLGLASKIDAAALADLTRGRFDPALPGVADELQVALRPAGGLLPHDLATTSAHSDFDTYEHRLLKHTLGLLVRRVRTIGELAAAATQRVASESSGRAARIGQITEGCAAAARQLRQLQVLPFLELVGPLPGFHGATPLLQRDPQYRAVYQMWQALRQQTLVEFDSPLFTIPITELPYLYEVWCALHVAAALLDTGGTVQSQRLVHAPIGGDHAALHTLTLADDAPLLVIERGDVTLTLRYQPRYRPVRELRSHANTQPSGVGKVLDSLVHPFTRSPVHLHSLDRHTRVPDIAIEMTRVGITPQVLVFDAKYRLDEDGRGVPQDALADAYAYLGAIGCGGVRATTRALLLYPGIRDEQYASGVGALALLPGQVAALAAVLGEEGLGARG